MISMEILFSSIAIIALITFVVTSVMIYSYLDRKGEKVSFLWLRLYMIPNANKYKRITKNETGKVGSLFYIWLISINTALICTILVLFIF